MLSPISPSSCFTLVPLKPRCATLSLAQISRTEEAGAKRRLAGTWWIPISLYLQINNRKVMSWIKDKKYDENDRKKLEKGGGFEKFVTIISHWFYRVVSW